MKLRYKICLCVIALAALVYAGTEVDQGKPGRYGSWPVSVSAISATAVNVLDGGYTNVLNTVVVVPDGGYTTIVPASVALLRTSNLQGIPSNGAACTTAGGASCTIILASTNYQLYQNVAISIQNAGANTINNVLVEWSPDNSAFEVWDSTTFANLAAGAILSMQLGDNSRKFLRIEARSASGSTAQVYVDGTDQAF